MAVCTGITLLGVAACGSAQDTPFYGVPLPPDGSASSGALVNRGGDGNTGTGGALVDGGGTTGASASGGTTGGSDTAPSTGGTPASGGFGGSVALAGTGAGDVPSTGGSGDATAQGGEAGDDATAGTSGVHDEGGAGGEAPVAVVDCSPHGPSARPFDGHCYQLSDGVKTFADAKSDCASLGAHLVTISSDGRSVAQFLAENAFVWQLAGATESWIGATDGKGPRQAGDGTYYQWITGEPMTLDNWSSGEPNNAQAGCQEDIPCTCDQGACYEHCGFLWDTPGKQMDAVPGWNDRVCDHQLPYVCEWDG